LLFLFLAGGTVTAILVLANAAINVGRFVDEKVYWKDDQYKKLEGLRAGFFLGAFDDSLGTPVFVRQRGQLREQTYRGRDFWVQAVSGPDAVVRLYSVLSCDEGFRPTFRVTGGSGGGLADARVTLQSSNADSVLEGGVSPRLNVFISGATANTRFLDIWSGGNPSHYQTFAWGYTDACGELPWPIEELQGLSFKVLTYRGSAEKAPPRTRELNAFPVNTYAEAAPTVSLDNARGRFQIGPDRILIRTTYPASR
jgi:hypothetical protein